MAAWVGYFRTEVVASKISPVGGSKVLTTINQPVNDVCRMSLFFQIEHIHLVNLSTTIYMQSEAATEPAGDKLLNETTWSGPSAEYSASGDPPGYIVSFTTDTGFFDADTDFDDHNASWTISYFARYTGTPPSGTTPYTHIEFYKRDESNTDTLLFSVKGGCASILVSEPYQITVTPTGTVATTDRLRIRIYISAAVPD